MIRGGRREPPRHWPEARRKPSWSRYSGLFAFAVLAGLFVGIAAARLDEEQTATKPQTATEPQALLDSDGERVDFGFCHTGGGTNCVVDGDTIWFQGENIRIVGLDTPETHDPGCPAEQALGDRATQRLHQLVNGGVVSLSTIDRDEDRYGRKLRIVNVDGESVADTLIDEGLAHSYDGGPKQGWC